MELFLGPAEMNVLDLPLLLEVLDVFSYSFCLNLGFREIDFGSDILPDTFELSSSFLS